MKVLKTNTIQLILTIRVKLFSKQLFVDEVVICQIVCYSVNLIEMVSLSYLKDEFLLQHI